MQFQGLEYIYPTRVDLEERVLRDVALSFKVNQVVLPGTRWRIALYLRPGRAADPEMLALRRHMTAYGYRTPFTVTMPQDQPAAPGKTIVTARAAKAATTIAVGAAIASGRRIGIAGKVYEVTAGNAAPGNVTIKPGLRSTVPVATPVVAAPALTVLYDDEYPLEIDVTDEGNAFPVIYLIEDV